MLKSALHFVIPHKNRSFFSTFTRKNQLRDTQPGVAELVAWEYDD